MSVTRATRTCWLTTLVMTAVWQTGCHRTVLKPSTLPPQYCAAPIIDARTLDLSRLSTGQYSSQMIHPGDTVNLRVITGTDEDTDNPWPVMIKEDGVADVPFVGPVPLAGLDTKSAQELVRNVSIQRGIYRSPTVVVEMKSKMTNRVTVMGAVKDPKMVHLDVAGSDLLAAIMAAGGVTEDAEPVVEIQRSQIRQNNASSQDETYMARAGYPASRNASTSAGQTLRIDLVAATNGPAGRSGIPLYDGDVVRVLERPKRSIQVMGLVRTPDRIEFPAGKDVRVLDAIAMAGGVPESTADQVTIVRNVPDQSEPIVIRVSLRKAKAGGEDNMLLLDGDHVNVDETPVTFVVGTLKQMVRIGVNGSIAAF